ncbi:hypothetical protein L6279_03400 [Candidatus Parcubacteria bacterium]|nr:hypothetical protein [Candidatus Parcubacteria bacterium]
MEDKNNLLKKVIIGGVIGLGAGVYVLFCVYLYGFLASMSLPDKIMNILVIPGLVLFKISAPIIGFFVRISPQHQTTAIIITWAFLGCLFGLIVGVLTRFKDLKNKST